MSGQVYGASTVKRYRSTTAELGALAIDIIDAIEADKPVTLRGVFYRVVSAGGIEKTELGYRKVGRALLKMRRAGIVDYGDITDGTRELLGWRTWDSLEEALEDTARTYRRALWTSQPGAVMLFTEKDAISGVVRPVAGKWDVPMGVLRGYASESFTWTVANYIRSVIRAGKTVFAYQLGDHDPSGVSAWETFAEKIRGFLADDAGLATFERIAVLPGQITAWQLPTRPTKASDPRARDFAGESVEVDAIPAARLRQITEEAITQHIDGDALRVTRVAEQGEREMLTRLAGHQDGAR
jgi:hypothetical protein